MRVFVQRVESAEVTANGQTVSRIGRGLLVYIGVAATDVPQDAASLAQKIAHLRIFEDAEGKLNFSVQDAGGAILAISNFTMMADAHKGRRPSFAAAANAEQAEPLYEEFVASLKKLGCAVARGAFGEHMEIHSVADGPVNLIVESAPGVLLKDEQHHHKADE